MSQLESETKPILGPMTQGHGTRLGKRQQETLATWLVKSSLVHAAMTSWENTTLFETAFQRFGEFRMGVLPAFAFVAAHGGKETEFTKQYFARYYETDVPAGATPMAPAYLFTIMLGHFVGVVTYSYDLKFPQPYDFPLKMILPPSRAFIWPRGRYMTLEDVDSLGTGPSVEELRMLRSLKLARRQNADRHRGSANCGWAKAFGATLSTRCPAHEPRSA
jgi:hypothetical protein